MPTDKIIAVVGATGSQGGGLVKAICAASGSGYKARALTRDPNSDSGRALAALGAEVVAWDLDDPETVHRAFDGAWGAYCVTFFWNHFDPALEQQHAATMANAAAAAGLSHVVWSTLEDTRQWVPLDDDRMPTLMGQYKVPHFDAKGEANRLFTDAGVPTTFLLTSFYWDNLIGFGMGPQRGADGTLGFTLPMGDKKLPGIAAADIGACAFGILQRDDLIGQTVGIAGEHLTGAEMAAELSKALGKEVRYNAVPPEVYRGFGFPGAEDLGNMFQFKADFEDYFCGARSVDFSRSLHPGLQGFGQWLDANKAAIPVG